MSEEVYREAPRSYWSLLAVAAVFTVGFVIDLLLGGGIAHLLGWLAATAIVTGIWALVLYAVRSEKSLVVTGTELRVGEEAIARSEIAGFAASLDEDDVPVLGWPRGKPRQLRGVTVRLADGSEVVVPTRSADRLRAALGLGDVPAKEQDVRAAAKSDLPQLPEIVERAQALYRVAGFDAPPTPPVGGDAIFVAGRPPVGFVQLREVDGVAHVEQLAVLPKWMRQGIGTRLLERAAEWAVRKGYPSITVVTFADVPWNAPFLRARGYVDADDPPAAVEPEGRIVLRRDL